jgi:octaprenyl-diphosphate synthase
MDVISRISKILNPEVIKLNEIIRNNVFGRVDLMNQIIKHIQKMNGKRIRILLMLLISKMYNNDSLDILKIAAAIEFIHNATLLHDDVIDNNLGKRRGVKTANKIWNNKVCVLSGDFLLSKSFDLIAQVENHQISSLLAQTSSTIIEGEVSQLIFNSSDELNYDQYIKIIEDKTATLFSAATSSSAILSGANLSELNNLRDFGKYLGIAFQIIDDGLDYFGTNKILGKPIGSDFREKKMTLPTILLKKILHENGKEELWRDELWKNIKFSRKSLKNIISVMNDNSLCDEVYLYAQKYILLARKSIEFMKNKGSFYDLLVELTEFVLMRKV